MQQIRNLIHGIVHNDLVQVNAPNGFTIAALTFADVQAYATLCLTLTSIVCTAAITVYKIKNGKKE